ncbi:ATP-binding protein [Candidatus Deferrimicrobium sp.]|uniref:ATP-binding protein n=1 Tax=Candidatus Deferrimicrobium sp. TaxID=3060586 RepID=UPI003C68AB7E
MNVATNDIHLSALPPIAPETSEETGLGTAFLVELACKILYSGGTMALAALSDRLALPVSVTGDIAEILKKERLAEVKQGGDIRATYIYALTDLGRERAREFLKVSGYAGAAPVTISQYAEATWKQSIKKIPVTAARMAQAFEGVVLPAGLLDRLGPAVNSGRSIFLYGPSGSGKTFIAERLKVLMEGIIFIPRAIAVDSHVIRVFDPVCHTEVDIGDGLDAFGDILQGGPKYDRRFVLCERPAIIAGGELSMSMLDLCFDPGSGYYEAPLQLKANGGIFVIDDLGRQMLRPFDLFNRWIMPLERGVDYLTLRTGKKFEIPFDQVIVFSTNIEPRELADEAFLRRLGYKIRIGHLFPAEYVAICHQVCARLGMEFRQEAIRHLVEVEHERRDVPLSACHPNDILSRVEEICRYRGVAPHLTRELVIEACRDYFTEV